jgi:hypothetical protein
LFAGCPIPTMTMESSRGSPNIHGFGQLAYPLELLWRLYVMKSYAKRWFWTLYRKE